MKVFKKYIMSNKFFYIEIRLNKLGLPKLVLSCHKHNLKPFLTDYIYRIISSKKQKGKPRKTDLSHCKKDITVILRLRNLK
jgi:hypothetical protein